MGSTLGDILESNKIFRYTLGMLVISFIICTSHMLVILL